MGDPLSSFRFLSMTWVFFPPSHDDRQKNISPHFRWCLDMDSTQGDHLQVRPTKHVLLKCLIHFSCTAMNFNELHPAFSHFCWEQRFTSFGKKWNRSTKVWPCDMLKPSMLPCVSICHWWWYFFYFIVFRSQRNASRSNMSRCPQRPGAMRCLKWVQSAWGALLGIRHQLVGVHLFAKMSRLLKLLGV